MRLGKRMLHFLLLFSVYMQAVMPSSIGTVFASSQGEQPLREVDREVIGEGVELLHYVKVIDNKPSNVYVTQVDLSNPYVKIAPLFGKNGILTDKQSVENMANERGAIAAINADFFHLNKKGTPFGIVLDEGELISSMGHIQTFYSLGIAPDQTAIIEQFGFEGTVESPDGTTFPLRGINKEEYNTSTGTSHENQLNMYTPHFGERSLGPTDKYEKVTEVVIRQDNVREIRIDQTVASIPADGYVLWGHGNAAQFLQEHFKIGDPVKVTFRTTPDEIPVESAVGGHTLLVDQGKAVSPIVHNITGYHARSAAAVSADGKMLYLIAVEGPPAGRGMSLEELASVLTELGVWRAFNLDGGGSTTMVARHLGDEQASLVNVTKFGSQRSVPTAVGIFNTAPQGDFAGLIVSGPKAVLKGSSVEFLAKGYDEHYHPYPLNQEDISWSVDEKRYGDFTANFFKATRYGSVDITAEYRGIRESYTIDILGPDDIEKILIQPEKLNVREGDSVDLTIYVKAKDGTIFKAEPDSLDLSVQGDIGRIDNLTFHAGNEPGTGTISADYEGVKAAIPVKVGVISQPWLTFDNLKNLHHAGHPASISNHGSFTSTEPDDETVPVYRTERAAKLSYNFSQAPKNEVSIAYGRLDRKPIQMPGTPLKIGVWVYGDNSGHWLRAEVFDQEGERHFVNLAEKVDWNGWRYVTGDIPYKVSYPLSLKSLYLVNLPEGADQRPARGTIYFDEVVLYQPYEPEQILKEQTFDLRRAGQQKDQISFTLGRELDIHMDVSELKKHTDTITIKPESVIPIQIPGIIPADYAFEWTHSEQSGDKQQLPVPAQLKLIPKNWSSTAGVGLMWLDPEKGEWQPLRGKVSEDGNWEYTLTHSGLYLPVYQKNPFPDTWGHWGEPAIRDLYQQGIIKGLSDHQFGPDVTLTRAQFITLLDRMMGWASYEIPGHDVTFTDDIPDWAKDAVERATGLGIVSGYSDQTFRPHQPLNRVEMAAFLSRALKAKASAGQDSSAQENTDEAEALARLRAAYSDAAEIPAWAVTAVAVLTDQNLMKGSGGKFQPVKTATRAEAAQLLYNVQNRFQ